MKIQVGMFINPIQKNNNQPLKNFTSHTNMSTLQTHGVTEEKKAELDKLSIEIIDAQYNVDQYEAIVASLTEKSRSFGQTLLYQETSRARTLANKNLVDQVIQNAADLKDASETAFKEITIANSGTEAVAIQIKGLVDKLIYAVEVVNKLSTMVIRKKALNPLISDELIAMLTTAGADADNAVALTLVALKSAFAAQASNLESEAVSSLENIQAVKLYQVLTENPPEVAGIQKRCLKDLLYKAYEIADTKYDEAYQANKEATRQLNIALTELNQAQVKLRSLQAGLAAANAAALAS
jgi:hypothetical protein